jgi:hypothetical protein
VMCRKVAEKAYDAIFSLVVGTHLVGYNIYLAALRFCSAAF